MSLIRDNNFGVYQAIKQIEADYGDVVSDVVAPAIYGKLNSGINVHLF